MIRKTERVLHDRIGWKPGIFGGDLLKCVRKENGVQELYFSGGVLMKITRGRGRLIVFPADRTCVIITPRRVVKVFNEKNESIEIIFPDKRRVVLTRGNDNTPDSKPISNIGLMTIARNQGTKEYNTEIERLERMKVL